MFVPHNSQQQQVNVCIRDKILQFFYFTRFAVLFVKKRFLYCFKKSLNGFSLKSQWYCYYWFFSKLANKLFFMFINNQKSCSLSFKPTSLVKHSLIHRTSRGCSLQHTRRSLLTTHLSTRSSLRCPGMRWTWFSTTSNPQTSTTRTAWTTWLISTRRRGQVMES